MRRGVVIAISAVTFVGVALAAWRQGGLLGLPGVPGGTTIESAGLAQLGEWKRIDAWVRGAQAEPENGIAEPCVIIVREGMREVTEGRVESGLAQMRDGVQLCPDNLVLGNAFRMTMFQLKREALAAARKEGRFNAKLPDHLRDDPIVTLSSAVRARPTREAKLQLALAWVDQMLLYPALEVKAPSSVEAVRILSEILEREPAYVPALFGRGLNHLHRPSRLVWPEAEHVPVDAAVQDIGRCVAIGRRFDAGSAHLQAMLAMTLGDAYVKAGRADVARSWWQIAQNLDRSAEIDAAVQRRYGWRNETMLDQLEMELDRARSQLDRPLSDLSFMWN